MTSLANATCFFARARESAGLNILGRLRPGSIRHSDHEDAGGVDIHRQLELPVLSLDQTALVILACGLRSAGLSVRTVSICIHLPRDVATELRARRHSCHRSVARGMAAHRQAL